MAHSILGQRNALASLCREDPEKHFVGLHLAVRLVTDRPRLVGWNGLHHCTVNL